MSKINQPTKLLISQIRRDGGTQPRAAINQDTVNEYLEDMKNGDKFPAVVVFYDGKIYWLADGFHRIEAAIGARMKKIAVTVKQGTRRDAVLYSVGANAKHGLRRSNADKRQAVMTLLEDEEWSVWSNREIAKQVCVSEFMVRKLRQSICDKNADTNLNNSDEFICDKNADTNLNNSDEFICDKNADTNLNNKRKVKRGGKTYIQDTTNIGKGKSSEPSPTEETQELTTSSEEQELNTPREELQSPKEEKQTTTPTSSEENNHPSDTPPENEEPNIRKLLSDGDRVRIKESHSSGGQFGIVTFIPNRHCAVVEFSPGKREVIEYQDFDFASVNTPPQPPVKKEIIIKEGLNYKAGCPGYGCKWYVEVSEQTYKGLQKYQEKLGTLTIDAAIDRFLEEEEEKEKTPNSDDIVLYFLNNVQQLPRERVNLVLEAFAKTHYDAFVETLQVIKPEKNLRLV